MARPKATWPAFETPEPKVAPIAAKATPPEPETPPQVVPQPVPQNPGGSGFIPQPVDTRIRRFGLSDLQDMGLWMVERLHERYPYINKATFAGWLRGMITGNQFLFLRSANAVMLGQITHRAINVTPIVEEIFLLVREEAFGEGVALYGELRLWATRMAAEEMIVERFSDVPHDMIKAALGRLAKREIYFVRINHEDA